MHNRNCSDRIVVENYVISVEAISFADFDEKEGLLMVIRGQEEPIILRGETAQATWSYLTSWFYGAIDPVQVYRKNMAVQSIKFERNRGPNETA